MRKIRRLGFALAVIFATCFCGFTGCKEALSYDKYTNANLYQVGDASFTTAQVKRLEIDWVAGSVEIERSIADVVQITEESASERQEERMRYFLDGDVLRIKYCQSGLRGSINERNKNLFVEIPSGISLEVESVSAGITIGVIEAPKVSIESVSGNIMAERIVCEKGADIETVSGKISIGEMTSPTLSVESVSGAVSITKLSVDSLDVETVSGELAFGVERAMEAEMESTSGAISVILAQGLGATVYLETATGKFQSERQYAKNGARYDVYGTELCRLDVDTFSGNVFIK